MFVSCCCACVYVCFGEREIAPNSIVKGRGTACWHPAGWFCLLETQTQEVMFPLLSMRDSSWYGCQYFLVSHMIQCWWSLRSRWSCLNKGSLFPQTNRCNLLAVLQTVYKYWTRQLYMGSSPYILTTCLHSGHDTIRNRTSGRQSGMNILVLSERETSICR